MLLRIALFLLIIVGIVLFLFSTPIATDFARVWRSGTAAAADPLTPIPTGPIIPAIYGPVTIEGEVWMDYDNTYEGIPYIAYVNDRGRLRTKQLVFQSPNGCYPAAGDLSCAPPGGWYSFPVKDGERIAVTGTIQADRLVVHSLERR